MLKEKYDAAYLEIDKVGHEVYKHPKVMEALILAFGEDVVEDGLEDRKKIGDIVFSNRNKMTELRDATWYYMSKDIDYFLRDNEDKVIILDWLLLPKTNYFHKCDIKILLDIPYEERLKRAMIRDGITEEKFKLRDAASIEFNEEDFDLVIKGGSKEEIRKRLYKI